MSEGSAIERTLALCAILYAWQMARSLRISGLP